ncbi:MAG: hypothetical protein ACR2LZ_01540 [Pyrinomonadaceae bacterium]
MKRCVILSRRDTVTLAVRFNARTRKHVTRLVASATIERAGKVSRRSRDAYGLVALAIVR